MTSRLESFLLKVESGAEKVVARALQRFRSRKPASEPKEAEPARAEGAEAEGAEAEGAEAEGAEAERADAEVASAEPSVVQPEPAPSLAASSRPAVPAARAPAVSPPAAVGERANLREPELPQSYGRSRVVVLAIDPHHVHAYWEITPADAQAARARLGGSERAACSWVLRFYDVTRVAADTASAHGHFDVDIDVASRNWYIELWAPDKTYLVEIGARVSGEFAAVCRAAPVTVPAAQLSPSREPEWRTADPERATTQVVPPSDPRLPQIVRSAADAPVSDTARSRAPGVGSSFDHEQPWVAATRSLDTEDTESAGPGDAPPTSKAPATRAATPLALALEPRQPGALAHGPGELLERSRSVSLPGIASGSGGSFSRAEEESSA